MAVKFKELAGSPVETFGPEGMGAERKFLVEWNVRRDFVEELLGDEFTFGGTSLMDYPGTEGIKCMRLRLESFANNPDHQGEFTDIATDINAYTSEIRCGGFDNPCLVTAQYEVLVPADRGDLPTPEEGTFLTYRMDFGGHYIEAPAVGCYWQASPFTPVPPAQALGQTVRVPVVEHHITVHRMINPPWQAISDLVGTVNLNAPFLGAAQEQILFDGCNAEKEFTWAGNFLEPQFGWKLSYVFREMRNKAFGADKTTIGWNHTYRFLPLASAGWDRLVTFSDLSLAYEQGNHLPLFQFAAE